LERYNWPFPERGRAAAQGLPRAARSLGSPARSRESEVAPTRHSSTERLRIAHSPKLSLLADRWVPRHLRCPISKAPFGAVVKDRNRFFDSSCGDFLNKGETGWPFGKGSDPR